MTVYWILLIIIAFVAYCMGSLSTLSIASVLIYRKNLRRLGRGNTWLSNFRRIYGTKGLVTLLLVEILKDLLPILLGSLLMGIKEQALVGRAFAGFCLVLGRLWPVFNRFRGSYAVGAMIVAAFSVKAALGVAALILFGLLLFIKRSMSLSCVAAAFVYIAFSMVFVDENIVMTLCILTGAMVIVRCLPKFIGFLKGQEQKLSFKEDISYKFDEKF